MAILLAIVAISDHFPEHYDYSDHFSDYSNLKIFNNLDLFDKVLKFLMKL